LTLHQVLAGRLCYTDIYIHSWNHYQTANAVSSSRVVLTRELQRLLFLDLGLAVTEINTKKVYKQVNKKT